MVANTATRLAALGRRVAVDGAREGAAGGGHTPQSGRDDLARERAQASFSAEEMCAFVHGGRDVAEKRARILQEFERDPSFSVDDAYDLTRAQQRRRVMTRLRSMAHWVATDSGADFTLRLQLLILVDPGFLTRVAVHYGLFLNTIMQQGTDAQAAAWLARGAKDFSGVIGCYAMTELGHGSNVAGIETTATYVQEADAFEIHTPRLTATKWWIGGAAESATHAVVFAQLVVGGAVHGVRPFVVPLRDPSTFALLPGVAIGDLGAKMGRNAIDNGWMTFTHVRVPRTHMLMRYTRVSPDGTVSSPPMAQLAYGALVFGRVSIVRESAECAKKAVVIAVRYACIRRQFGAATGGSDVLVVENESAERRSKPFVARSSAQMTEKDALIGGKSAIPASVMGREIVIMDYDTHQQRLMPMVAFAYAVTLTGAELTAAYDALMGRLAAAKTPQAASALAAPLKALHATSAGLKALCTWRTLELIETCRQALGGLGYSSYAGLATLLQDFAVQCTWEGDNTVLTLQTGRFLVGAALRSMKQQGSSNDGREGDSGTAYLAKIPELLKYTVPWDADLCDTAVILAAYEAAAARLATDAAREFSGHVRSGMPTEDAHLRVGVPKATAGRMHCSAYMLRCFASAISRAPPSLQPVLRSMCVLHGLWGVRTDASVFVRCGVLLPVHLERIEGHIASHCALLRPQAVALTDAFGLTDYALNSALGCSDGDVYARMFDRVRRSCPPDAPHAYFADVIRPVIMRAGIANDPIPDA